MSTDETVTSGESIVRLFGSEAEGRVLSIVKTRDLFRFVEEKLIEEKNPGSGLDAYEYWAETHRSGLYQTAEEALADARSTIAWLKD